MKAFVWAAIFALNVAGLFMMARDKHYARHGSRRIAERTLFVTAMAGGASGIWLGMYAFRHKTHHARFRFGIPALFVVNLVFYRAVFEAL